MVEAARALQQDRPGRHDEPQPPGGAARRSSSCTTAASARSTWRAACASSRAPSIGKYPDGPMAAGREVQAERRGRRRTSRPTTRRTCRRWTTTCGSGPAPKRPFNRNRFHYNWHWHWDYGNGDTGNQGPHQFDIARWGLGKQEHPVKVSSMRRLLRRRVVAGNAGHADGAVRVRRRHDPRVRHARRAHQRRRQRADRQPVLRHQGLALDRRRRPQVAVVLGPSAPRTRRGRAPTAAEPARGRSG